LKKIFLLLPVLFLFPLQAFATDYPVIMNNGTVLLNTGVGFGMPRSQSRTMKCPPLTISLDTATPLMGLPFTLGIITGYLSEKHPIEIDYHYMPIGLRLAYHKNLFSRLPRFDNYIVLTLGYAIPFPESSKSPHWDEKYGRLFWFGLGIGSRYFFLPNMGVYFEFGIDTFQILTLGLTFKI